MRGFIIGLIAGAAVGIGGALAFSERTETQRSTDSSAAGHTAGARQPALLPVERESAPQSERPEATTPHDSLSAAPPEVPTDPDAAYRKWVEDVRAQLRVLRDAEPGSETVTKIVQDMSTSACFESW